uniref:Uncharacterized protein n=1 Tax=Chromera velia CCMP2878 TaxID=1169474 RepID=A0A0G4HDA3_9ALVE|eukprot:Cvel_6412.t1-p1 / transcript=Cvel_6412.t1 / gene=Cvel_6412 / organism=Chromera_velia_CCMP2878 / gene_product=hypothetical protein / transcript_product=hypothetical protein / location=Cvel_scaffold313:72088-72750(+) / protein_length=221 / sequence_SO=supercontig / SO=protein_coding / is_pseudo=false
MTKGEKAKIVSPSQNPKSVSKDIQKPNKEETRQQAKSSSEGNSAAPSSEGKQPNQGNVLQETREEMSEGSVISLQGTILDVYNQAAWTVSYLLNINEQNEVTGTSERKSLMVENRTVSGICTGRLVGTSESRKLRLADGFEGNMNFFEVPLPASSPPCGVGPLTTKSLFLLEVEQQVDEEEGETVETLCESYFSEEEGIEDRLAEEECQPGTMNLSGEWQS